MCADLAHIIQVINNYFFYRFIQKKKSTFAVWNNR